MTTNFLSDVNWIAVIVAATAYFLLGAVWYGVLFSKKWTTYHKVDMANPELKKGTAGIMIGSYFLMLLCTIGLAIFVERLDLRGGVLSGLKLGLLSGLLFSATALSITYLYLKKPSGLHWIDGLYHTTGQVIAAIILCLWR
jgi:hypothetical protein